MKSLTNMMAVNRRSLPWLWYRLAWFPLYVAVLAGCVVSARRAENPRRTVVSDRPAKLRRVPDRELLTLETVSYGSPSG